VNTDNQDALVDLASGQDSTTFGLFMSVQLDGGNGPTDPTLLNLSIILLFV
jgi:hypothetical protein